MSDYKPMGCEIRGLQADYSKESLDISDVHCLKVRSRIWLLVICICMCIYIYMINHMHTHTHTHIHTYTYMCVCVEMKNTVQIN